MGEHTLRILGVDPGSQVTGYGVVERESARVRHVAHGTLRPPRRESLAQRLSRIHEGLTEILALYEPDVAVVEQVFVGMNARAALMLGQARGTVLAVLGGAALPVDELSSSEIKQAVVGTGRAQKAQVQHMVQRLLSLSELPVQDAADALAAAICRAHQGTLASLGATRRPRPRARGRRSASFVVRRAR